MFKLQFIDNNKNYSEYEKIRAMLLSYSLLLIAFMVFCLTIVRSIFQINSGFPLWVVFFICTGLFLIFRLTHSLILTGNLFIACLFLVYASMAFKSGGIFSEDVHGIHSIALISFVVLGRKGGIIWSIPCLIWIIIIAYISNQNIAYYSVQRVQFEPAYYIIVSVVNVLLVVGGFYFLLTQYQKLTNKLRSKRNDLEHNIEAYKVQTKLLEKTQIALQKSNTELERYAYAASHDLKQPLRNIASFSNLLERKLHQDYSEDKDLNEYLEIIQSSTTNMNKLVEGLLSYARIKKEEVDERILSDLNIIKEKVLSDLRSQIEENKVEIIHDALPKLNVIPILLQQLFQNLISNAIKFRKQGQKIILQIKAHEKENEWVFEFKDNGIGIEKEQLKNIFKPFRRLHSNSNIPGTGIGLASCEKIINIHNGKIYATSELGVGSSFIFTLPKQHNPDEGLSQM